MAEQERAQPWRDAARPSWQRAAAAVDELERMLSLQLTTTQKLAARAVVREAIEAEEGTKA